MGFTKKYINDEITIKWLNKNLPIEKLFKADSIIIEGELSYKVLELYDSGIKNTDQLKENIRSIFGDLGIN
jgi:hypothetical protein